MLRPLTAVISAIVDYARALSARTQSALVARPQRAVTMLEWVLIATIAVALFLLLRSQLTAIFQAVIDAIKSGIGAS